MNYRDLLVHSCDQLFDSRVTMRKKAADAIMEWFLLILITSQSTEWPWEKKADYSNGIALSAKVLYSWNSGSAKGSYSQRKIPSKPIVGYFPGSAVVQLYVVAFGKRLSSSEVLHPYYRDRTQTNQHDFKTIINSCYLFIEHLYQSVLCRVQKICSILVPRLLFCVATTIVKQTHHFSCELPSLLERRRRFCFIRVLPRVAMYSWILDDRSWLFESERYVPTLICINILW